MNRLEFESSKRLEFGKFEPVGVRKVRTGWSSKSSNQFKKFKFKRFELVWVCKVQVGEVQFATSLKSLSWFEFENF